jgi:hypothetical protein
MARTTNTIDYNALNRLIGRLLSHHDVLTGWPGMPTEIIRDVHSATVILDEVCELLDCVERTTNPRSIAAAIVLGLPRGEGA